MRWTLAATTLALIGCAPQSPPGPLPPGPALPIEQLEVAPGLQTIADSSAVWPLEVEFLYDPKIQIIVDNTAHRGITRNSCTVRGIRPLRPNTSYLLVHTHPVNCPVFGEQYEGLMERIKHGPEEDQDRLLFGNLSFPSTPDISKLVFAAQENPYIHSYVIDLRYGVLNELYLVVAKLEPAGVVQARQMDRPVDDGDHLNVRDTYLEELIDAILTTDRYLPIDEFMREVAQEGSTDLISFKVYKTK